MLDTGEWGFGGFSGLHLAPDLTVTAISDVGHWWRAPLLMRDGQLAGVGTIRHGPLRDAAGVALPGSPLGDAECLARLANGDWLVGFERRHRILRYRDLAGPGVPFDTPPGLTGSPNNGGLEALTLLRDGRLLAISEALPGPAGPTSRMAWFGSHAGARTRWTPTSYIPVAGMDPTDAAALPDGGALVLERSFSLFRGFKARLARIAPEGLQPNAPLMAETWLDLPSDAAAENWEGVAVTRHGGQVLVALMSDDNQSRLQQSLLLLYAMAGD